MKKKTRIKLKNLVEIARLVNHDVILDDKIKLIHYTEDGRIRLVAIYDYDKPSLDDLEVNLTNIAKANREKWQPEFEKLLPSVFTLNWDMEFDVFGITFRDNNHCSYAFTYGSDELIDAVELLTDAILQRYSKKSLRRQQKDDTGYLCGGDICLKGNHCKACTKHDTTNNETFIPPLPQSESIHDTIVTPPTSQLKLDRILIRSLWDELDNTQRRLFLTKLTDVNRQILETILNVQLDALSNENITDQPTPTEESET